MKYNDEQNCRHFLDALRNQLSGRDTIGKPFDCPPPRWASLNREAKRSLESYNFAVNEMVRRPYGKNKQMVFGWTED